MRVSAETTAGGVAERTFVLGDVPGVLWTPAAATGTRPLILLAHGGGQHKRTPGVVARAHRFVTRYGWSAVAIDAPGHGDRPRSAPPAGGPGGDWALRAGAQRAARAVLDWRAVLAGLGDEELATGPVGFHGVSMGTVVGVPLLAAEP